MTVHYSRVQEVLMHYCTEPACRGGTDQLLYGT